jgi:hypothetical protein
MSCKTESIARTAPRRLSQFMAAAMVWCLRWRRLRRRGAACATPCFGNFE